MPAPSQPHPGLHRPLYPKVNNAAQSQHETLELLLTTRWIGCTWHRRHSQRRPGWPKSSRRGDSPQGRTARRTAPTSAPRLQSPAPPWAPQSAPQLVLRLALRLALLVPVQVAMNRWIIVTAQLAMATCSGLLQSQPTLVLLMGLLKFRSGLLAALQCTAAAPARRYPLSAVVPSSHMT